LRLTQPLSIGVLNRGKASGAWS